MITFVNSSSMFLNLLVGGFKCSTTNEFDGRIFVRLNDCDVSCDVRALRFDAEGEIRTILKTIQVVVEVGFVVDSKAISVCYCSHGVFDKIVTVLVIPLVHHWTFDDVL